jgi:integrase/recombinase XerD
MPQKYLHYFGNESSESILQAYGIITNGKQDIDKLRPKQCHNCTESNKPDSKFFSKCRMVLTYYAYNETLESQKEKDAEVQIFKEKFECDIKAIRKEIKEEMKSQIAQIVARLKPEIVKEGLS